VVPMPSVGRVDVGVQWAPSKVAEQLVTATIPLTMVGKMGLPTTLVAPTQVEVAAAVIDGS